MLHYLYFLAQLFFCCRFSFEKSVPRKVLEKVCQAVYGKRLFWNYKEHIRECKGNMFGLDTDISESGSYIVVSDSHAKEIYGSSIEQVKLKNVNTVDPP